jgi:metal-responsive CopG/Arc/MetJ family transcriptional regulator
LEETAMKSHTIEVTGVSEHLLELLDKRITTQNGSGRSEYVRELIRKDVVEGPVGGRRPRSFREILGPIHEETARLGIDEGTVDALLKQERALISAQRRKAK